MKAYAHPATTGRTPAGVFREIIVTPTMFTNPNRGRRVPIRTLAFPSAAGPPGTTILSLMTGSAHDDSLQVHAQYFALPNTGSARSHIEAAARILGENS